MENEHDLSKSTDSDFQKYQMKAESNLQQFYNNDHQLENLSNQAQQKMPYTQHLQYDNEQEQLNDLNEGYGGQYQQDNNFSNSNKLLINISKEEEDPHIPIRKKLNNSEFKRNSSQSIVNFNGNRAINDFKQQIPTLNIQKNSELLIQNIHQGGNNRHEGSLNGSSVQNKQMVGGYVGNRHNISRTGQIIMNIDPKQIVQDNTAKVTQHNQDGIVSLTHSRQSIRDKQLRLNNSTHNRGNNNKPQSFNQDALANFAITSDFVFDKQSIKNSSQQSQNLQFNNQKSGNNLSNSISSFNYNHGLNKEKSVDRERFIPGIEQLEERPENEEISPHVQARQVCTNSNNSLSKGTQEIQSATLNFNKLLNINRDEEPGRPLFEIKSALYPPAEEIYKTKVAQTSDYVRYGLNMYFRKYHPFSMDPDSAGGVLATNQAFLSMPWGVNGCPPNKQINLTTFVKNNLSNVVFCRYGMEYLKSFPRVDDIAIGSYKINLDHLVFQRQKDLDSDNNAHLVGMSFLKAKGQVEMQRRMHSPTKKGVSQNAALGGPQMIIPFYKQLEPEDTTTLKFDSVFESGNLAVAVKTQNFEYNLLLQNDINTNGHTQWFYFKVKSRFEKKTTVKFNIINLYKPKSLYQYGMKILVLDVSSQKGMKDEKSPSKKKDQSAQKQDEHESPDAKDTASKQNKEDLPKWKRAGQDICYVQNCYTNETCPTGLFQIQFTYEFDKGDKEVYFAHSVPYTYSMLQEYLNQNVSKEKAKRETLCHSLAGNKVEYLLITNKQKPIEQPSAYETATNLTTYRKQEGNTKGDAQVEIKPIEKQVIVLTSRVHPGETNASWMMHGLMETLLNPQGKEEQDLVRNLKDYFEIYIIPMLNVDGVVNGNYRCSLAACDLNRKWSKPQKVFHPTVYYTKQLCEKLMVNQKKAFFLYLDFHGHSAKKNIFQYGNKAEGWSNVMKNRGGAPVHSTSVFPLMLSKQFDYFNFNDCTFQRQKNKESTARIAMFDKLKIPFVFTLEASFAGASKGKLAGQHFSIKDQTAVGKHVLFAIWETKKLEMNKNMLKQIQDEVASHAKIEPESGVDSDGCDSSEEEALPPTSNNKKVQQIINDNQESPRKIKEEAMEESKSPEKLTQKDGSAAPSGPIVGTTSAIVLDTNKTMNSRQKQRGEPNQINNVATQKSYLGQKGATGIKCQNNNLKTISSQKEGQNLNSKARKSDPCSRIDRFTGQIGQSLRQSIGLNNTTEYQTQQHDEYNINYSGQNANDQVMSQQSNYQQVQNIQGIQGQGDNKHPQMHSHSNSNANLPESRYSSGGLNQFVQTAQNFSLMNKLIKTEQISESPQIEQIEMNESNYRNKRQSKQELFQQFNEEIEKSFHDQQTYLDEVFKQTTQQFMEHSAQKRQQQQSQFGSSRHNASNSVHNQLIGGPPDSSQTNNSNYFLDQFLIQQKINRDREKTAAAIDMGSCFGQGAHYQSYRQNQHSGNISQISMPSQSQSSTPQVETFMQLQKLHQMQKLNQIAQMQFFRQQAELLLSQNLTQQQQLDLFQQFSFYQAQIQIQNQQYQLMLNQSIHGNNMSQIHNAALMNSNQLSSAQISFHSQEAKCYTDKVPQGNYSQQSYKNQQQSSGVQPFPSNSANTSYSGTITGETQMTQMSNKIKKESQVNMTNLANIVMTGEQYSGHQLKHHDNNVHPNVMSHTNSRRNQQEKVYRGFGVPSYSVNQSQQKGIQQFQSGNELTHHDNNTDYMSPKSVPQKHSKTEQMGYARNSDGQINPQFQIRTNKVQQNGVDVMKPRTIINSPPKIDQSEQDRDSKIGLTGRSEVGYQQQFIQQQELNYQQQYQHYTDKKQYDNALSQQNQIAIQQAQQPIIRLKRGLVDFKQDNTNEELQMMPQLIPQSRPIASLHTRRPNMQSQGNNKYQKETTHQNLINNTAIMEPQSLQSFAQILNQQLHDPNSTMKIQHQKAQHIQNEGMQYESTQFMKNVIDPVYQKRFFQTRSGRFTNKNSAQKYYIHQMMHIASSDIENSDGKMVPIQGGNHNFESVRSPPIEGFMGSTQHGPMQTRPSSRFTYNQNTTQKASGNTQIMVAKHHNQSAPNNNLMNQGNSLYNTQTMNNNQQYQSNRRQQIEHLIEQNDKFQSKKFESEINKIDHYIHDKHKRKESRGENVVSRENKRQMQSNQKNMNNTSGANGVSFMFTRPSLDGKQNNQNIVDQFNSLNTPVLQSKSGSRPNKGFGILTPPDRERQYIPVRQNIKRMPNHGHTKSDANQQQQ